MLGDPPRRHQSCSREVGTRDKGRLEPVSHQFVPIIDLHVRPTDRSSLDPDLNVSQTWLSSESPRLIDGTRTRNSLDDGVHLFFQRIPLNCSRPFRSSVKRYCPSKLQEKWNFSSKALYTGADQTDQQ